MPLLDMTMYKLFVFVVIYNVYLLNVECLYYGDSCTRIQNSGTCTPLPACKPLMNEIAQAGNPMPNYMSKRLHSLRCGFDDVPLVCCKSGSINESPDINDDKPINNNAIDNDSKIVKENKTVASSRIKEDILDHPNFHLLPKECGVSNGDRIAGGEITALYEMPWMVLLSYEHTDLGPVYRCGGTLITEWYVLTAAHCVKYLPPKLRLNGVLLGEYDTKSDPDCLDENNCAPPVRNVTINETIVHENYKQIFCDIALIRLSEPADFSLKSMKPICLPTSNELKTEELEERTGEALGWGITEEDAQSQFLLSLNVPIIPLSQCKMNYKGQLKLDESQLCAGGIKGQDTCRGDSGGPLQYISNIQNSRYIQRGIVSYGLRDCAEGDFPTIYTKVSYYLTWILDNMHN